MHTQIAHAAAAAAMVTAWGTAQAAITTFEIDSDLDLIDSVIGYTTSFSSRGFQSVGEITAGNRRVIDVDIPVDEFTVVDYYIFAGIFENQDGSRGVVLNFNFDYDFSGQTYDDIFGPQSSIAEILTTFDKDLEDTFDVDNEVEDLLTSVYDGRFFPAAFAVDVTEGSRLVAFNSPGTAVGFIYVPSPGAAAALALAGIAAVRRRR